MKLTFDVIKITFSSNFVQFIDKWYWLMIINRFFSRIYGIQNDSNQIFLYDKKGREYITVSLYKFIRIGLTYII